MSFISNNTFRVLGVSSSASLKDIQKNISKLKAFAKIGRVLALDYDLSFLNLAKLDRTDNLLLKSENQLNLDKNKVTSSLFWFADLNPIDSMALAHLFKGDISKATNIWDKSTTSKEVNLRNYSAFNNLSTFCDYWSISDSLIFSCLSIFNFSFLHSTMFDMLLDVTIWVFKSEEKEFLVMGLGDGIGLVYI